MKKNKIPTSLLASLCLSVSGFVYGQVGINTTSPQATLDVVAKTTDGTRAEGLIAPRLTGDQMKSGDVRYGTAQDGALVYATAAVTVSSAKTVNVTSPGYYYYDAPNAVWMPVGKSAVQAVVSDCNSNGFSGGYYNGISMTSSNTFSVTLTNNSFTPATIAFQSTDLSLSGVSGISVSSVSPSSVNLSSGQSQQVTYTLTGTPAAAGTLTGTWSKLALSCVKTVAVTNPAISGLNCSGATNSGTLTQGNAASGVSSVISYTGGNGSSYGAQSVASTGVTGLTATLSAGTFSNGSGDLTYSITGTPSGDGTASFAISIGGQSCTFTRTVNAPITIPSSITLAQNKTYMIASVYDQDYLPYTAPTGAATTNTQAANGVNESVTVNVQGSITTTGVTLSIPVTATGSGTLPAFSQTITIPAALTEDNTARDLILSWASQSYTSSTTSITATLKAVGGTLNAKKLDINTGIGNDALGVLLGQFIYPYNSAGNTTTYSVRDIAGIPDKMFGLADNTGSTTTHMMLYLPVVAEDGNIWLNNNLGADYANINKSSFNPAQQATGATDFNAYGSLFQWGRKPDGHELINWTNGTSGTPVNGTTTTLDNNPANALFIRNTNSPYDWRSTQNDTLWATSGSANNPCPVGFRLPTVTEQNALVSAAGITNSSTAAASVLKFSVSGVRDFGTGSLSNVGSLGYYRSSSVTGTNASNRIFTSGGTLSGDSNRTNGFAVRCLKD